MPDKFPIIDTTPRDAFLTLFEPHLARRLKEIFLECGPRAGIVMPADIMGAVVYHLRALISSSNDPAQQADLREILLIAAENWDLAEAFGDYCVRYSALPEPYRVSLDGKDKPGGLLANLRSVAPPDYLTPHVRGADSSEDHLDTRISDQNQTPLHDGR